jgi:hypothetical protein
MLSMILFTTMALADVCSFVTKEQAELGARLLQAHPDFVKYCPTCPDKSKTKVHAEKVEALAIGQEQYWGVFVDKHNIDLAYTYLDTGENNGINLAILSGCETPSDVPRRIELNDVAAESKIVPTVKPPENPQVKVEPKESSMPQPPQQVEQPKEPSPIQATNIEKNPLHDADQYFNKKNFAAALRLYEDYVEKNQAEFNTYKSTISKCYYNLGVQTIQKASSKKDCGVAADYFSHCLYLDPGDTLAGDALKTANFCKEMGPYLPKLEEEIQDLELRK